MYAHLSLCAAFLILATATTTAGAQSSAPADDGAPPAVPVRMAWLHRDVGLLVAELDPLAHPLLQDPAYRRALFEAAVTEFLKSRWPRLESRTLRGERIALRSVPVHEMLVVRAGNCIVLSCRPVVLPRVVLERFELHLTVDPRTKQTFSGAAPTWRRVAGFGSTMLGGAFLARDVYNSHQAAKRDQREGMDLGASLRYLEPFAGLGLSALAPILVTGGIPVVGAIVLGGTASYAGSTVMRAATEGTHILEANLHRAYLEGRTHFDIDAAREHGLMGTLDDEMSIAASLGAEIVVAHRRRIAVNAEIDSNIRRHISLLRGEGWSDETIAPTLDRFGVPPDRRSHYLFEPTYPCRGCAYGAEIPAGIDDAISTASGGKSRSVDERGGVKADIRVRAEDFVRDSLLRRHRRVP